LPKNRFQLRLRLAQPEHRPHFTRDDIAGIHRRLRIAQGMQHATVRIRHGDAALVQAFHEGAARDFDQGFAGLQGRRC
jgi:hypothetical protein